MTDWTGLGAFPGTPQYSFDEIPDLTGKVAIVTGANTGIGKVSARELLKHGAKVYAACRSKDKAEKAIAEIKRATGKEDIHFLQLDLGSIAASISAADAFLAKEDRLDILINSAGVMEPPAGSKTSDGYELQWGTNVLCPFAFTQRLFPALIKASEGKEAGSVRVVWVSSCAHFQYLKERQPIDYSRLEGDVTQETVSVYYGWSKLANIQLAHGCADRLSSHGILCTSLHPGLIKSDLYRHYNPIMRTLLGLVLIDVEKGALTQLYAATSPKLGMADSKAYFVPLAKKHKTDHPQAEDPAAIAETWARCEAAVAKATGN